MTQVSVDAALAVIRDNAPPPRRTRVRLEKAFGRILLEPVRGGRDQPPFDSAAMDGYAVKVFPNSGETLKVIGESQAGRAFTGILADGATVRTFTGAPLPQGATQVIVQEDVVRNGHTICLRPGFASNAKPHVRRQGSDFRAEDVMLQAGDRLTTWRLALVAATGTGRVTVARRPKISLICAGNELVAPGGQPSNDQVFETNSFALNSLARHWGAIVVPAKLQRDNQADLTNTLRETGADIVVTVGGASVGDYDFIRPAVEALGVQWLFQKIDLKPGKPTAFGILSDGRPVLCLPGNPGAALICGQLFLRPLIERASGAAASPRVKALPCATGLPANGPRETFLRAVVLDGADNSPMLLPLSGQDSSEVGSFAVMSALIRRRANAPAVPAGAVCECVWLD